MSNCNATNLSVTTNTVVIQDVNRRIDIVVPNCETTVSVTQPVTNVITIAVPGPQGITGEPGAAADISQLNIFTGSIQTQVNNLTNVTASYATTGPNTFIGNQIVSGSITVSDIGYIQAPSFTGSLFGTASWANNAITASFVTASNVYGPYGSNSIISASYAISASFASTASYVNPLHQNVIITGSLFVTQSHISTVDYIDFTPVTTAPGFLTGRLHWTDDTKTLQLDTDVNGFELEIGHQSVIRGRNTNGFVLTKGTVVYINGESGNRPLFVTASWEGDPSSATTIGIIAQDINDNQTGYAITNGLIRGVNTNAFPPGTSLYLSSSGQYTDTPPASPLHEVRLGKTVTSAVNGIIYIDIMNGYELGELHDVLIVSASDGDLISWSSGSRVWKNTKQLTGSYGLTGSLNIINGGITGSLLGTSSFALTAATASFVTASNVYGPFGSNSVISASYSATASVALVALNAGSSFPFTGSAIISGSLSVIGPVSFTGSLAVSSSAGTTLFSSNADTLVITGSLLVTGSINLVGLLTGTASYALEALSSSYAITSSFAQNAISASFASTASFVLNAVTASYVTGSIFTNANLALSASYALTASHALNALTASYALTDSSGVRVLYNDVPFSSHTGTTNDTVIAYKLIPANTIAAGDVLWLRQRYNKTSTIGTVSARFYVNNTSSSLSGATLIGSLLNQPTTNRYALMERSVAVSSSAGTSNNNIFGATPSLVADNVSQATAAQNVTIDWTQDQYIQYALQLSNAGDTVTLTMVEAILFKKTV